MGKIGVWGELSRRLDEGLRAGATAATVDEAQARIRKLEEDCAGLAKYIHEGLPQRVLRSVSRAMSENK
eukprot:2705623-Amphidinium_carterae.1